MKRCIFIISFLLTGSITFSQSDYIYFNKRYFDIGSTIGWSYTGDIIETGEGYVLAGACIDTGTNIDQVIPIIQIDQNGNLNHVDYYGREGVDFGTGFPGSFMSSESGSYYFAGGIKYFQPSTHNVGMAIKLSSTLDSVWIKEYHADKYSPIDSTQSFYNLDICTNGDLVFTGELYYGTLISQIVLLLADSNGNQKFVKYFGTDGLNRAYSIIQTSDGGFAIGGFWYIPGSPTHTGDPIVIKTDGAGNKQWEINLGEQFSDNKAMLSKGIDESIIVGTVIEQEENSDSNRVQISKLNNEGDIIWNKQYGISYYFNYLTSIHCLNSGDIIASGTIPDLYPHTVGWLFKVDSTGDSLWYRQYTNLHGSESENSLYNVVSTADNGLIACGWVRPFPPDTGLYNNAWILKLDSLGCDTPGCNTGVWIPIRTLKEFELYVYPNPAYNHTIVTFPPGEYSSFEIFDIYGRKQEELNIQTEEQIQLDLNSYKPGIYLGVLKNQNEIIGSCKIVVSQ